MPPAHEVQCDMLSTSRLPFRTAGSLSFSRLSLDVLQSLWVAPCPGVAARDICQPRVPDRTYRLAGIGTATTHKIRRDWTAVGGVSSPHLDCRLTSPVPPS